MQYCNISTEINIETLIYVNNTDPPGLSSSNWIDGLKTRVEFDN
jgi:hypothetical protein